MNPDFLKVIAASPDDRRGLFLKTANRIGTTIQNIEKDFWVTWVLDLLFNGKQPNEPRLLFKGGTSLSKAYGLIFRFSEDIDITVFREDIGQQIKSSDLTALSGKQQRAKLDNIKKACQNYVQGPLLERLNFQVTQAFSQTQQASAGSPVLVDPNDSDGQTLLFTYPSVVNADSDYILPSVKIEAGAKSALDPHKRVSILPYIAQDFPSSQMRVDNVLTIDAERTFWDKIIILHGLRRWHDQRGELRQQGQRVSRHYYDLFKLSLSREGEKALADSQLGEQCAQHAMAFFNNTDLDLKSALRGSYSIAPSIEMETLLRRDYQAMVGMGFGEVPQFSEVIAAINALEKAINSPEAQPYKI